MDNFGVEAWSGSTALNQAQNKDLFEPDGEERPITTTRKLPITLVIEVSVNLIEPPYVEDDAIRASMESYVLKALAAHKYLQTGSIRVVSE